MSTSPITTMTNELYDAIVNNDINLLNNLFSRGLTPYTLNFSLSVASGAGNINLMKFFISKGANDFDRAIESAIDAGQLNAVKFLVSQANNLDLNAALIYAAVRCQLQIVQYLINNGATDIEGALDAIIEERNGYGASGFPTQLARCNLVINYLQTL